MGGAVPGFMTFCGWFPTEAWISVAPHLPMAFTDSSDRLSTSSDLERRLWFLQALARAHTDQVAADVATRGRWRHAHAQIEHAAAVRMVARRCARERTLGRRSACGGGMQRLCHPWLLKSRVEPARNLIKKQGERRVVGEKKNPLLAKPRLGAV